MKQSIHCLLIDDDADDHDFFGSALKEIGDHVTCDHVLTAREAIDKLASGACKPRFIFLDLNMMPMNGLDCLLEIKKNAKAVDVPVIIYSTAIDEDIKYKTLEAGAFDHFEKPAKPTLLVNYLKKLFQVSK